MFLYYNQREVEAICRRLIRPLLSYHVLIVMDEAIPRSSSLGFHSRQGIGLEMSLEKSLGQYSFEL